MAKKLSLFSKTEGDLDAGNIKATGVGLREGELAALDSIAAELEVNRNALLRFAVRYFLIEYQAGRVDLAAYIEQPPPPKKILHLPEQD